MQTYYAESDEEEKIEDRALKCMNVNIIYWITWVGVSVENSEKKEKSKTFNWTKWNMEWYSFWTMMISTPALTFLWNDNNNYNININCQHQQMKPKERTHTESERTAREGPTQMIDTMMACFMCNSRSVCCTWTTTHVAVGYRRFWQRTHTHTHKRI